MTHQDQLQSLKHSLDLMTGDLLTHRNELLGHEFGTFFTNPTELTAYLLRIEQLLQETTEAIDIRLESMRNVA